jgi:ABC-2 type transport system ATP-binding protein
VRVSGRADQLAVSEESGPAKPPPGSPALALRGIDKNWGGRPVLQGLDLELAPGGLYWVGGRNGAGKTTMLRIASGLITADTGEVRVFGVDPERERRAFQSQIGFLPAGNGALYARLSVAKNLDFWAALALIPRSRRPEVIRRAIDRFGLSELAGRRVDRMSMGQRQRVRLAITFIHDPKVVLLDEPHTSLDDDGMALVAGALERLRDEGGTGIWCSPKVQETNVSLDGAYLIDGGKAVPA